MRPLANASVRRPHFIIDASALIPLFYQQRNEEWKARDSLVSLIKRREEGRALLHIPDFCLAECSKALARIAFGRQRDFARASDEYRKKTGDLFNVVSGSRPGLIDRIGLTRNHLVDVQGIFLMEYALHPRDKSPIPQSANRAIREFRDPSVLPAIGRWGDRQQPQHLTL